MPSLVGYPTAPNLEVIYKLLWGAEGFVSLPSEQMCSRVSGKVTHTEGRNKTREGAGMMKWGALQEP